MRSWQETLDPVQVRLAVSEEVDHPVGEINSEHRSLSVEVLTSPSLTHLGMVVNPNLKFRCNRNTGCFEMTLDGLKIVALVVV